MKQKATSIFVIAILLCSFCLSSCSIENNPHPKNNPKVYEYVSYTVPDGWFVRRLSVIGDENVESKDCGIIDFSPKDEIAINLTLECDKHYENIYRKKTITPKDVANHWDDRIDKTLTVDGVAAYTTIDKANYSKMCTKCVKDKKLFTIELDTSSLERKPTEEEIQIYYDLINSIHFLEEGEYVPKEIDFDSFGKDAIHLQEGVEGEYSEYKPATNGWDRRDLLFVVPPGKYEVNNICEYSTDLVLMEEADEKTDGIYYYEPNEKTQLYIDPWGKGKVTIKEGQVIRLGNSNDIVLVKVK